MSHSATGGLQFDHVAESQRAQAGTDRQFDVSTCKPWCYGEGGRSACEAVNRQLANVEDWAYAACPSGLIYRKDLSIDVLHRHFSCRCKPLCYACHGKISGARQLGVPRAERTSIT